MRAFPDGASKEDEHGRLPLHLALLPMKNAANQGIRVTPCSAASFEALLQAYPSAAEKADNSGRLPLHYACDHNPQKGVVEVLLKTFPQPAEKAEQYGALPLHYACQKVNAEKEVVEALLKAFPQAAEKVNNEGKLPLQYACWRNANKEVVKAVLLAGIALECLDFLRDEYPEHLKIFVERQLNEKVLHSAQPLREALSLSSALFRLSHQLRSTDTRLSSKADERAAEILQLACAVARSLCPFYQHTKFDGLRKELDACLELMVAHRLKAIVSDFARLLRELWFGNPWRDFGERVQELRSSSPWQAIFPDVIVNQNNFHPVARILLLFLLIIFFLLFLVPFAVLTFAWPSFWKFWLDRLAYLAFCIITYLLPRQIEAGADITSPRLETAAAVLLFSFLWQEVAQFTRIIRKSGRRGGITHAELLVKIRDVGVKVDKALERHKKPEEGSETGAAPDVIILPEATPELEDDSELGTAINELKKILRQFDIQKSGLGLTRENVKKITAAGDKVDKADKALRRGVESPLSTPELVDAISDVFVSLSAVAAAGCFREPLGRRCCRCPQLFVLESWKHHAQGR
jgi:hypothetical protein